MGGGHRRCACCYRWVAAGGADGPHATLLSPANQVRTSLPLASLRGVSSATPPLCFGFGWREEEEGERERGLLVGGAAGSTAFCTTPFDVVKTRLQTHLVGSPQASSAPASPTPASAPLRISAPTVGAEIRRGADAAHCSHAAAVPPLPTPPSTSFTPASPTPLSGHCLRIDEQWEKGVHFEGRGRWVCGEVRETLVSSRPPVAGLLAAQGQVCIAPSARNIYIPPSRPCQYLYSLMLFSVPSYVATTAILSATNFDLFGIGVLPHHALPLALILATVLGVGEKSASPVPILPPPALSSPTLCPSLQPPPRHSPSPLHENPIMEWCTWHDLPETPRHEEQLRKAKPRRHQRRHAVPGALCMLTGRYLPFISFTRPTLFPSSFCPLPFRFPSSCSPICLSSPSPSLPLSFPSSPFPSPFPPFPSLPVPFPSPSPLLPFPSLLPLPSRFPPLFLSKKGADVAAL
ncbi:unnamed protein product [Closterium sp. Naga37s-1]|nr:unnamed protein product [Closterium sp. Naga37s-1]